MPTQPSPPDLMPHHLPSDADTRAILVAMRRMAIHGLRDATAANILLANYGMAAQRLTILMRSLLVELAQSASGRITIAPCCAPRMTDDERNILGALAEPEMAADHLLGVLRNSDCLQPLTTAQTLSCVLIDIGKPVLL